MPAPEQADRRQDKTLEDTFPASDPPANSGITGAEPPAKAPDDRTEGEIPTGRPTSDRHATETAYQREDEEQPRSER